MHIGEHLLCDSKHFVLKKMNSAMKIMLENHGEGHGIMLKTHYRTKKMFVCSAVESGKYH